MTQSDDSDTDTSQNDSKTQDGFLPIRAKFHRFFHRMFSRKPAYIIRQNGVEVRYFNFNDTQTLPFDTDTYKDTQLFIGSWANPWYLNVEEIEDHYPDFTKEEITEVNDVFEKDHIYPSQRWKTLANQNVLSEMFVGRSLRQQRVVRLLYAVLGAIILQGIYMLFG